MKAAELDAVQVCKEFEDVLAPRLKLSVLDRAVYSHLLRHSRHEGKLRLRFSIVWLANNMGVTARRVRQAVRRLVEKGVLRLIERSNVGHIVEVLLPREVRAAHSNQSAPACSMPSGGANLEQLDF
jgi:predicted DNA-binding transcriptional regulator